MHRPSVAWLLGELPKLVAAGVLSPEAADAVRRHYATEDSGVGRRLATALLSVLARCWWGAASSFSSPTTGTRSLAAHAPAS
jgi:hypothetical protein